MIFCFLVLIAKFSYRWWQKTGIEMLKAGQNRTTYRKHVDIYLKLFLITVGRKEMWRPLSFAIPCFPLLSFPGLGRAGWPRDCREEGKVAPAAAPAVPGLGGQAAPAARGSGKMALPGSLPAFVAQFHPLSSPTGAILGSFLLSPRRVGRCRRAQLGPYFCVLSGKHSCLGLWEPLREILKALLPSRTPHSFPSLWLPSWGGC